MTTKDEIAELEPAKEAAEETSKDASETGPMQTLRDRIKEQNKENAELRKELLVDRFGQLGLDPTKGLGKAIAKEYRGPMTVEAIAKFATEEYDYSPPQVGTHPQAQQIAANQAVVDQVGTMGVTDVPEPSEGEMLAKAEAEGDWATAGRIKAARLARMRQPIQ